MVSYENTHRLSDPRTRMPGLSYIMSLLCDSFFQSLIEIEKEMAHGFLSREFKGWKPLKKKKKKTNGLDLSLSDMAC
jgi:hypothetical protein